MPMPSGVTRSARRASSIRPGVGLCPVKKLRVEGQYPVGPAFFDKIRYPVDTLLHSKGINSHTEESNLHVSLSFTNTALFVNSLLILSQFFFILHGEGILSVKRNTPPCFLMPDTAKKC
jgi:hypothetical protein